MMKEKKSPYVLDGNKVAVRDAAGDILEMVENVLDRYGIHVPMKTRHWMKITPVFTV